MSVYETVKGVMDQYGIPDYIWYPIMMSESGGNPNSDTGNLPKERSVGLFQINTYVHPYSVDQLKDPKFNAQVAARDFIAPAYQAIKDAHVSPESQTSYVWRYGIRPAWDMNKDAAIRQKTANYLKKGAVDFTEIPQQIKTSGDVSTSSGDLSTVQQFARFGVIVGLAIVTLVVILQAIPKPTDMILKGGKA